MGTTWRELRGSAGFTDPGCVSGEPVHQRATGMLHTALPKNNLQVRWEHRESIFTEDITS